jgi:glutathione synthase/RimK-type ligase-like ATP-grasp enzyme
MNIVIVYPKVCTRSAKLLAFELNAELVKLSELNSIRSSLLIKNADKVFNYGCSNLIIANKDKVINSGFAVSTCVDKMATNRTLKMCNVPTVDMTTSWNDIPKSWKTIVYRPTVDGNRAKGLEFYTDKETCPKEGLYSKYYKHDYEMRIVVYKGKIAGRYIKEEVDGEWHFVEVHAKGLNKVDKACVLAANTIGIDFVGFDILAKDLENFVIIEANSGSTMTPEVLQKIKLDLIGE